jgi:microcystin-dependent protein
MVQPFIGEIRMFAGTFAPVGWALCDGQLLSISQNEALFSLLGTAYGGDGRTTYGLPDLRGRVPIHMGPGPGLTPRTIGAKAGLEQAPVSSNQLPLHTHALEASSDGADETQPGGAVLAAAASDIYIDDGPDVVMSPSSITTVGNSQSHDNVMPFRVVNYIVSLTGTYPSRN